MWHVLGLQTGPLALSLPFYLPRPAIQQRQHPRNLLLQVATLRSKSFQIEFVMTLEVFRFFSNPYRKSSNIRGDEENP
jgi:hypothetical protein